MGPTEAAFQWLLVGSAARLIPVAVSVAADGVPTPPAVLQKSLVTWGSGPVQIDSSLHCSVRKFVTAMYITVKF